MKGLGEISLIQNLFEIVYLVKEVNGYENVVRKKEKRKKKEILKSYA